MAVTPEELRIRISAQNDASKSIKEVRKDLAWLSTGVKQTQKAVMGTNTAISGMGRQMGMAGIQVQQLVGQIQGGTSAFVAFSQQAADLGFVLGFPLLGAVVGIASAFAGPLVAAIMGVKEETEDLTKKVDDLAGSYETLTGAQRAYFDLISGRQIQDLRIEINALKNEADSLQGIMSMPSKSGQDLAAEAYKKRLQILSQISELEQKIEYLRNPIAKEQAEERLKIAEDSAAEQLRLEDQLTADFTQRLQDRIKSEEAARKYQLDIQDNMTKEFLKQQELNQKAHDELVKKSTEQLKPLEDGFINLINGSKDVSESFSAMARSIINDLIRIQIQQSITKPLADMMANSGGGSILGSIGSLFGLSFAGGGYTGSGARSGGVDGKGGFPAILHPNETVVDHTQGQSGGGVTIVQNINVTTGVQQTVRAEIQNLLPQISNAAKMAVADSRMRGGNYSKALVGA